MNWAHVHLILNHVPVLGTLAAFLRLAGAMLRKSDDWTRGALGFLVAIAVLTLPVYFTGEPAKGVVERLPGVSEAQVDEHEEFAETSLVVVEASGMIALAGLLLFRRPRDLPRWIVVISLVASLASAGMMAWTAYLGGHIRHAETRPDFHEP